MNLNVNIAIQVDSENRIVNIGFTVPLIHIEVSPDKVKEELEMFVGKPNSTVARKMIAGKLLRLFNSDAHESKRF